MTSMTNTALEAPTVVLEDISLVAFANREGLFQRILRQTRESRQSVIHYLNIHVANTAFRLPRLKTLLQRSDMVYCDGSGIQLGAWLSGQSIPARFPAADWFIDFLKYLALEDCKVFLLGGMPGVPGRAMETFAAQVPHHSVIGTHHGYILKDPMLERQVIEQINRLRPDLLIVGFGTPLQEFWIEEHRHELKVKTIYGLGAVLDYFSGQVPRCPRWMGNAGLEWLFRLWIEPARLMGRYVVGNPWFLARVGFGLLVNQLMWPIRVLRRAY